MPDSAWQSYDLIFFDCDSTLSAIEGIDELARFKGKGDRVGLLTSKAMDGELDLAEVYGKRLRAIRPTRAQLKAIEERYWETMVEDAAEVIAALHYLGKQVFIISGGLIDAVKGFGRRLGVDASRIRAVELEYNQLSGQWWRYHEPQTQHAQTYLDYDEGPLTVSKGKSQIISELADDLPGRRIMIGDGASDLAAKEQVDLFIGYGGVLARDKVKTASEVFVSACSLAPILPIAAGRAGWQTVAGGAFESLYLKGINLARDPKAVSFQTDKRLGQFIQAFEGITTT
ncbi:MAG: HAD-IB family phosphatase [Chloroflexi bacterium]|nr:HAD-IB family phosphatase [Chloroflexota bacterium]